MYSEIMKNCVKLLSVDIVLKIFGFFVTIFYLSLITKSDYGILGYISTIVSVLSGVLSVGQYVVQSKFYHDESLLENELEVNIHFVIFTTYIVFLLGGFLTKDYWIHLLFANRVSDIVVYSILFLPLFSILTQILSTYLYAAKKIKEIRYLSITQFILSSVLGTLFLWLLNKKNSSLELALIWIFISQTLILLRLYPIYFDFKRFNLKIIDIDLVKRNLNFGIPIAISGLTSILFELGDKYMIQRYIDNSSLGIFTFAGVWANIPMILFSPFQNIWLPYFYKEKDIKINLNRTIKIASGWIGMTIVMVPILSSVIYIISGRFVDISYQKSIIVLCYLLLASGFQIASHLYINFYNLLEINQVLIIISVIMGTLNMTINYLLIPIFGLNGVALSTLIVSAISIVINFLVVNIVVRKKLSTQKI